MGTTPGQLAPILEALEPLPISVRRMFGEYAIYLDDRVPAFVTDGVLGVKITDFEMDRRADVVRGPIFPGSKDYWRIPRELLADRDWLRELIMETTARLEPVKVRRPKTTKPPSTGQRL